MNAPDSLDPRGAAPTSSEAIHQLSQRWIEAVKAKDIDQLLRLVTDDIGFLPPGMPPIKGKDAVSELYRSLFAQFDVDQAAHSEETEVAGDWAYSWGTETLTLSPLAGGPSVCLRGKGLTILRRQHDGSWKFARGINNSVPQ
jgi:uncharacterized protein (TIGR02246 family)